MIETSDFEELKLAILGPTLYTYGNNSVALIQVFVPLLHLMKYVPAQRQNIPASLFFQSPARVQYYSGPTGSVRAGFDRD